jgi:hypothetical protein
MTRDEAVAAVKATTEPKLRRGVFVVAGDKRWPVTPAGLGTAPGSSRPSTRPSAAPS